MSYFRSYHFSFHRNQKNESELNHKKSDTRRYRNIQLNDSVTNLVEMSYSRNDQVLGVSTEFQKKKILSVKIKKRHEGHRNSHCHDTVKKIF